MFDNVTYLRIPPRMSVRYYQAPTPEYWDMRKLTGKWYWRGLNWVLKKLGGRYRDYVPESWPVEERKIDHSSIIAMLETSKRAMQDLWDKQATTLVIGYDEMEKLMQQPPTEPMQFNMFVKLARQGRDYESFYPPRYVTNTRPVPLRVVLVPWLSGWALLPDLGEPKESEANNAINFAKVL